MNITIKITNAVDPDKSGWKVDYKKMDDYQGNIVWLNNVIAKAAKGILIAVSDSQLALQEQTPEK